MNKRIERLIRQRLEAKPITAPPNLNSTSASRPDLERIGPSTNLPVTPQSDMERCLAICVKAGVYTIANPSRMMRCGKDATLSVVQEGTRSGPISEDLQNPRTVVQRVGR